MKIDVLTLFPEMFTGVFNDSILKRAQASGAVELNTVNFREFSENKHKKGGRLSLWWWCWNAIDSPANL